MFKRPLRVLLIDDDEEDYLLVRDLLAENQRAHTSLDRVNSYAAGLAAIATQSHDAYLIDYRLGPFNGLQLISEAIAQGCTAPLILLTGQDDQEIDGAALQGGANDFLVKSQISALLLERAIRYAVERARGLMALRASNERYRLVTETATDAIITTNQAQEIVFANQATEKIFGYQVEELLGQPISLLLSEQHPVPVVAPHDSSPQANTSTRVAPTEHTGLHKSGQRIPLEMSHGVSFEGSSVTVTRVIRDISERKRFEEQLRQAQKMEAVGRLAGGVAHDFNNVLTTITGFSELLLDEINQGLPPNREDVTEILKAAQRATKLTHQLLAFSRKQVLQPDRVDLNAVLLDMEPMLRRLIGEDIVLQLRLERQLGTILVDRGQIEQVIMNLVVNARDAMPRGGHLTISTRQLAVEHTGLQGMANNEYITLTVHDTGHGMDAATQNRAFEPFFTTKEQGRGTGLGLSTVYGIVKQSGGEIYAESALASGTTFTIYLPHVALPASTQPAAAIPQSVTGSETILLVEDEVAVRNLLRVVLHNAGYRVLSATNGNNAEELVRSCHEPIDLVVTDVVMPQLSGIELVSRLVSRFPTMRVLFMSGYTDEALTRHGSLGVGVAFLQKPFTPTDLLQKIRTVLDATPVEEVQQ